MNGDGTPDFGSCIAKQRNAQSYWFVTDVVGSLTQSKGTSQGTFFNTEDMTPLVDNAAFRKALEFLQASTQYGPPDELNLDVSDTRPLFASGRCALNLDWGDVGTISIDSEPVEGDGQVGRGDHAGLEAEVLDWETGELVACDAETCPHAIDGVNHAPFAAFGGWGGGINAAADPKVKDAAYAYFSFMTQPAQSNSDVTIGGTGFNPYRTSQLAYSDLWKNAGMSEEEAEGLPRRDQREHVEPEHDPRPAHPAEPEVPAGRARRGDLALPLRRDRRRGDGQGGRRPAGTS